LISRYLGAHPEWREERHEDDLRQAVWEMACKKIKEYTGQVKLITFFYRRVEWAMIDEMRRLSLYGPSKNNTEIGQEISDEVLMGCDYIRNRKQKIFKIRYPALKRILRKERNNLVHETLKRLSFNSQYVLRQHFFENKDYQDIAKDLEMHPTEMSRYKNDVVFVEFRKHFPKEVV